MATQADVDEAMAKLKQTFVDKMIDRLLKPKPESEKTNPKKRKLDENTAKPNPDAGDSIVSRIENIEKMMKLLDERIQALEGQKTLYDEMKAIDDRLKVLEKQKTLCRGPRTGLCEE